MRINNDARCTKVTARTIVCCICRKGLAAGLGKHKAARFRLLAISDEAAILCNPMNARSGVGITKPGPFLQWICTSLS